MARRATVVLVAVVGVALARMPAELFVVLAAIPENRGRWSDGSADPRDGIVFGALGKGTKDIRVRVGACSQWYGYDPNRLILEVDNDLRVVRLLQ